MDDIMALAKEHNLFVIEDCAQAHGAYYKGRAVGTIGDIAAWSFCQDKIMTTGGEGGMVTTNSATLWDWVWSYKDHGKSWSAVYEKAHPPGFRWLHERFGSNYRMTEIQAVLGRIQLGRMSDWSDKRLNNANRIWQIAAQIKGLRVPQVPADIRHAAYKCYVFVNQDELASGWDTAEIMKEINARGVPCYAGSCSEIYLEKAFDNTSFRPQERLPVAKRLGESSLMFLVHPTLTDEQIDKTCSVLGAVMAQAATSARGSL